MSYSLAFHPQVKLEVHDSLLWYNEKSEGLGDSFLLELEQANHILQEAPTVWPKAKGKIYKYNLKRFPFIIYYKVTQNTVFVYAVAHASRRPGYWLSRRYQQDI